VNLVIDPLDPGHGDLVVMPTRLQIHLGQFDLIAEDMIDLADMMVVGAHNLHMLADLTGCGHDYSPFAMMALERASLLPTGSSAASFRSRRRKAA
jgi:hypothetical protein